ncbi:MAG TPA: response regulator [Acetobacteraceae bacterium]|nr:response regulator [Acetobacteraceae bacterium]
MEPSISPTNEVVVTGLVEWGLDDLEQSVNAMPTPVDRVVATAGLQGGADLLVTDVGLPNGMNGRQLADAARELRPGLKVLFITGYAENALLSEGHLGRGMQAMTKPFTMEELAVRLRDSLGEG